MSDRAPVPMLRVEREETVQQATASASRDVASVFPSEATKPGLDPEAVKEMLGARAFISETELAEVKASGATGVEVGAVAADKPLQQVLAERQAAKEEAFADRWKTMKQGKNRPLDEDEQAFVDQVYDAERRKERQQRAEEAAELSAFRQALKDKSTVAPSAPAVPVRAKPAPRKGADASKKRGPPVLRVAAPVLKVTPAKPKVAAVVVSKQETNTMTNSDEDVPAAGGLAGLLGGYGSDDGSDGSS